MGKIGFACKWIDFPSQVDGIGPKDDCKKYNTGATTITWLNRQTKDVAEQKLWDLINQNKSGKIDASYSIWALLAIESWCMQFVDGIELYKVKNKAK